MAAQPAAYEEDDLFKPVHAGRAFVGDFIQTAPGAEPRTLLAIEVQYKLTLGPVDDPIVVTVPFAGPGNEVLHRKGPRLARSV